MILLMRLQKIIVSALSFLIASLVINIPISAQSTANMDAFTAEVAQHLAIKYQLSEIPENIRLQFEQNPLQLPPDQNDDMLTAFKKAYDQAILLDDFEAALSQKKSEEYAGELRRWLKSDQTQLITDTRQQFYTLQGKRKRVITMYEMEQNPPSQSRIDLIKSLTNTTGVVESTVESSVIILRSVIEALDIISDQRSFSDTQIDGIANNFRAQIQAQTSQEYEHKMLVLFHPVDSSVLKEYANFWETEPGQWLTRSINESIGQAYKNASARFLESVQKNQ